MRTLSGGFLAATGRYYARLTLPDGSEIGSGAVRSLTLTQTLNSSTEGLTLGGAGGAALTGVVTAPGISLQDKKLRLYLGRMVSGVLEEVALGDYWVSSAVAEGDAVTISAVDAMTALMSGVYTPGSPTPTTALGVLRDVCAQAGVTLGSVTGLTDVSVSGSLTGYTMREMVGYMSALLGRCACMDGEGRLVLRWYTPGGVSVTPDDYYSGGLQLQSQDWTLSRLDCTVTTRTTTTDPDTGTTAETEDSQTLTAGTGSGVVGMVNPWMTQSVLDSLLARLGGLTYRGGTVALRGDLRLEPGDLVTAEALDGASHTVAVMETALTYDGGLRLDVTSWAQSETERQQPEGPLTQQVSRLKADVAEFKSLSAQNLTATNASIQALQAEDANIRSLVADKASVGDLDAANARITDLQANSLTAESAVIQALQADKADVTALNATNANVTNLSANLANVNNLLAGSAGVGDLQAIHLTGANAVIDDAIITDAMIAGLSAGKLTAGTIYTSLVKIASDQNENLLIDGAGLQLKDSAGTIRVQIGKDAAGDYNLALWDAAGKLLWDASGVYAAGLHDGIIRDVAVAEDANIAGSKLDIASVAERLNEDGSLTVDAGHVQLDATTLDVAYKTLTQANAALRERTTALETDLTVVQGKITSKVWQSDITAVTDPLGSRLTTVEDQYSQIDQQVGSIQLSVASVKSDFENLAVGGRNLIVAGTLTNGYRINSDGTNYAASGHSVTAYFAVDPGSDYLLKAWEAPAGSGQYLSVAFYDGNQGFLSRPIMASAWEAGDSFAVTAPANAAYARVSFPTALAEAVKFERGTVATDWTPAPEDVDHAIQTVSGALELKIGRDENDQIVSMLNASADEINLTGDRLVISSTNFQLAADGTITAKNGNFSGKITATNGTIGGWTLGGTKIYGGDGETGVAVMQRPDTSNTYVFAAGGTNHSNYSDCPFRVTKHGMLYAESGEIGGWTVTGKRIYGGDAKTGVAVMQRPTADTVNVFAAGGTSHDDYTSCPFRVTKYGQLYAGATELTDLLTTRSAGQAIKFPVSNGGNYKITTTDDNWALARYNTSDEWLAYILRFTLSDLNLIVTPSLTVNSSITASGNITTSNTFFCDRGYNENVYFSCYWKDGASHALVNRGTDGLTSSFGWAGNSGYPTITNLRGQTVRAQNAAGTTTLSDERLKTDWRDLDSYDAFFDALDPRAFKYVDGSSGRYHLGFGAQSVERALADSGLDNTDFGGLVKFPVPLQSEDWRGYDEEYGLIYTEFVALLVDQVQKLKREVRDLKNQMGGNANV